MIRASLLLLLSAAGLMAQFVGDFLPERLVTYLEITDAQRRQIVQINAGFERFRGGHDPGSPDRGAEDKACGVAGGAANAAGCLRRADVPVDGSRASPSRQRDSRESREPDLRRGADPLQFQWWLRFGEFRVHPGFCT